LLDQPLNVEDNTLGGGPGQRRGAGDLDIGLNRTVLVQAEISVSA
jgi:hypothetical protein